MSPSPTTTAAPPGAQVTPPLATDYRLAFIFDQNAPMSLVGSVIAATSKEFEELEATILVTCASPCPTSVSFPEQTIKHISGSIWQGEHSVSSATTSWDCTLGTGINVVGSNTVSELPHCTHSVIWPGGTTSTIVETLGDCDLNLMSKLLYITAGQKEWHKVESPASKTPEELLSSRAALLKGCPTVALPAISGIPPTAVPKGESNSQTTAQATATPSQGRSAAQQTKLGPMLLAGALVLGIFGAAL